MSIAILYEENFPAKLLAALGALVVFAIIAVAVARVTTPEPQPRLAGTAQQERALRFEDRADGGINVLEANTRALIAQVEPGTNGFLRSTLRGLARERKRRDLGSESPFILAVQADGRLLLADPATGRDVDLGSFGPANAAVFRQLLRPDERAGAAPGIILNR